MATSIDRSGRCLCGAVTFLARLARAEMDVCHCGMCQRWSGGVFMAVPCENVDVSGADSVGVYVSSDWAERVFCKDCGASLIWRMRDGGLTMASFQALDDKSGLVFAEEIFIDEKPDLYAFAGHRRYMTGSEAIAAATAKPEGVRDPT